MEKTARTKPPSSELMWSTIACSMCSNTRLDAARRVDHESPGRRQHSTHLANCLAAILHEHQSHLAEDDVVGIVAVHERARVAHAPIDS